MCAWFWISRGGGEWSCVREWQQHCNVNHQNVSIFFLGGGFLPHPNLLLLLAPMLRGLGEAIHSELLGTKRVKGDCKISVKCRRRANISTCRLNIVVLSISMQQKYFLLPTWVPKDAAILVHSLSMKSRKRLVHDVMYISATMSALFMMSQTRTAEHKVAALVAKFFATLKHWFLTSSVQFSSVQPLDRLGHRGDMRVKCVRAWVRACVCETGSVLLCVGCPSTQTLLEVNLP